MEISKLKGSNKKTGVCKLRFQGDMDIYAAEETLTALLPYFDDFKTFNLELDQVGEIDSSGIQLLLQCHRHSQKFDGQLTILSWSENVQELASLYQLSERFDISQVAKE